MVKNSIKAIVLAFMAIVLVSCAQDKAESDRSIQERILNAYLESKDFKAKYPNAQVLPSGIVILEQELGFGDVLKRRDGAYFEYTTQSLSGEYINTTDENIAKQLGIHSNSNYYGPALFEIGYKSTYVGLEEVMTGMQEGGRTMFILPPWLTNTENEPEWGESSSMIFDLELKHVITDILKWEEDTMKAYANLHYPGLDTLSSNFYFKSLEKTSNDTLESGTVQVYYIGRLLDGFVFDTNIEDTAKKYGIYNPENDYKPLDVIHREDLDEMLKDNSLVTGFCMAVQQMGYNETAFTMFGSKYGYDSDGKAPIGPYQSLIFWLQTGDKED